MLVHCNVKTRNDTNYQMIKNEPWAAFGAWIKEQREARKISQGGAAKRAEIDRQQWFRIENGLSGTRRDTVIRMAHAISADVDEALRLAGFAPLNAPEPRGKPSTLADLLDRLDELGVTGVQFYDADKLQRATPDELQDVLDAVSMAIELVLKKKRRRNTSTYADDSAAASLHNTDA